MPFVERRSDDRRIPAHKIDVATYLGPGNGYYCKTCLRRVSSKPGSMGYRHAPGTVRSMTD